MVQREVPDGGSLSLAELCDEYGEAIDFDMRRFCGVDLSEYLTGRRPASEALRRIQFFPPESATVAQMKATPPQRGSRGGSARPPRWRVTYGQTPVYDAVTDLWDLQAARGGLRGKKAKHPRGSLAGASRRRGRSP